MIRRADITDAQALGEVHVASWRAAYRGIMPDGVLDALDVTARVARWRENLSAVRPDGPETWVLVLDDAVRGFVGVGPSRDSTATSRVGEIYALYLSPELYGRGHGRALMARALELARQRGYDEVMLWVLADNARARRFYEAAGMSLDGGEKTEEVYGAPLAHVRYRAGLESSR